jgi:hypothetical protein
MIFSCVCSCIQCHGQIQSFMCCFHRHTCLSPTFPPHVPGLNPQTLICSPCLEFCPLKRFYIYIRTLYCIIYLLGFGTRDWTQGFAHARQGSTTWAVPPANLKMTKRYRSTFFFWLFSSVLESTHMLGKHYTLSYLPSAKVLYKWRNTVSSLWGLDLFTCGTLEISPYCWYINVFLFIS